jgi:hypothetical protein
LYETDQHAIYDGCAQIWQNYQSHHDDPAWQTFYFPQPSDSHFPIAIVKLKPSCVFVTDDGTVFIEMGGGFFSYGLKAFLKRPANPRTDAYLTKELLPGFWFYAEDGKVPDR